MMRTILSWDPAEYRKWLPATLLIRLVIFIFFAYEFSENWTPGMVHHGIVVVQNDSPGYFAPMESLIAGNGYSGACRMPGFLPVYAPLRTVLSPQQAELGIVVLQFLTGVAAIYLAALGAYNFRKSKLLFLTVLGLLMINSYVSIWDHALMSDSFSISLLLIAFYFLSRYYQQGGYRLLFWTGLLICWSVFFRPSHILFFPAAGLIVLLHSLRTGFSIGKVALSGVILALPAAAGISAWTLRNYIRYDKIITLQNDDEECFATLVEYNVGVRNLVISWGCDYQGWSLNTELAWFLDRDSTSTYDFPPHVYTSRCNYDTLVALKHDFTRARDSGLDPVIRARYQQKVISRTADLRDNYRQEKPMHYYVWNRLRLIRLFIFPSKLDNLPLPKRSEMNPAEFGVKSFYYLMLLAVSAGTVLASVSALFRRDAAMWVFLTFPLSIILIIGALLGYAEQRYLAPAYPFMVMASCLLLTDLRDWWLGRRKQADSKIPA
jgi:hypothetical protein